MDTQKARKPRKKPGKVGENKSEIVREIPAACADESLAVEFMEKRRWGAEPCCPHCGSVKVYKMTGRDGQREKHYRWRCRDCGKQYSVRTGTVFEDSRISLRHWCYAFWAACASKKGVSAKQIQRQTGLSYKSALFLMHRIRWAMREDGPLPPLDGTVEVDETYVGGKTKNPHGNQRKGFSMWDHKVPVVALVQRDGKSRAFVPQAVNGENLKQMIRENVQPGSKVYTDGHGGYIGIDKLLPCTHESVSHYTGEYVRGEVHSNTVESWFSLLKRGMMGTFHAVSREHLFRYCDEFSFRWDTRQLDDGARTEQAIKQAQGKRLTYRKPSETVVAADC